MADLQLLPIRVPLVAEADRYALAMGTRCPGTKTRVERFPRKTDGRFSKPDPNIMHHATDPVTRIA